MGVSVAVSKYGDGKVTDLSDWGRPIARMIAKKLISTPISVIQVTNLHLVLSLICSWLIIQGQTITACALLVVKGVIDAVDGELARMREKPSHVGRYWDTVADTIGLIAVMCAFGSLFEWGPLLTTALILATLIQYSLFNHYSIILRSRSSGDSTSRMDETVKPTAYPWEKQSSVNFFHMIYLIFFSWQDRIIAFLAGKGSNSLTFELTVSSTLGFGLQSLIIMVMAITTQLIYLPELILGVNFVLMAVVLLRSHL